MGMFDTLPPKYLVNVLHEDKFLLYFYKAWFVSLRRPLLGNSGNSSQEAQFPRSHTNRPGWFYQQRGVFQIPARHLIKVKLNQELFVLS